MYTDEVNKVKKKKQEYQRYALCIRCKSKSFLAARISMEESIL